jgi:hypothetical protein
MKKVLFGTTALVGALTLAHAAQAQSINVGGALDLSISGANDFGVEYAAEDLVGGGREWTFNQDTEIVFAADGVADTMDLAYGANIEVELETGGQGTELLQPVFDEDGNVTDFQTTEVGRRGSNVQFDEIWGYVEGTWGEVRFGNEDSAVDILNINGAFVAAGTGGIDGNQRSVIDPKVVDSGESTKVLYFTPNVAGFQAGASYSIRAGDFGETFATAATSDFSDVVEVGANWQGDFAGIGVGAFGGYVFGSADDDADDDLSNFQVGGSVSAYGIGLAGSYANEEGTARDSFWNIGVGGEFAGVGLSFGYQSTSLEGDDDNTDYFVFSGDVGLLPGVALRGDVAFADFDDLDEGPGEDDFGDGINALLELRTVF